MSAAHAVGAVSTMRISVAALIMSGFWLILVFMLLNI
jgi:hypothetical protein